MFGQVLRYPREGFLELADGKVLARGLAMATSQLLLDLLSLGMFSELIAVLKVKAFHNVRRWVTAYLHRISNGYMIPLELSTTQESACRHSLGLQDIYEVLRIVTALNLLRFATST